MSNHLKNQQYYKGNIVHFDLKRHQFAHIKCVGEIVDVEKEESDFFYWIQCPNSAHRVHEKNIKARYIDMNSGNY